MNDLPRTLLLAEDDDDDAFLTTRALEEAGITHRIERRSDGQAVILYLQHAFAAAASGAVGAFPDLVLLDLKMPGFGGLEVLRWIRSQDGFRTLIVLALTSSTQPRDVATAYQLQINAYLVKPSSLRELVGLASSIRAFWLDRHHLIPPPLDLSPAGPAFYNFHEQPSQFRPGSRREDDPDDRELLLRQLRKSGLDNHVKFISDGREALDFLTGGAGASAGELVALFIDLKLPSVDGIEILRRLRLRDEFRDLPVIVMTSSNNPRDLDECEKLKVIKYVTKPVTFPTFSKAVADVFHLPRIETEPPKP